MHWTTCKYRSTKGNGKQELMKIACVHLHHFAKTLAGSVCHLFVQKKQGIVPIYRIPYTRCFCYGRLPIWKNGPLIAQRALWAQCPGAHAQEPKGAKAQAKGPSCPGPKSQGPKRSQAQVFPRAQAAKGQRAQAVQAQGLKGAKTWSQSSSARVQGFKDPRAHGYKGPRAPGPRCTDISISED